MLEDKITTPVARYCPHLLCFRRRDICTGKTKAPDIKSYDLVHSELNKLNLEFIEGFYKNDGMDVSRESCQAYK